MRYALKRDTSHRAIAVGLRAVGATVAELFDIDLAVNYRGRAWIIEVKTREYTEAKRTGGYRKGAIRKKQELLREIFGEQYVVAYDLADALKAIGAEITFTGGAQ